MAELSTELVEYIVDAASRGFNPHYDKIDALARDLLEARNLLRESKREHKDTCMIVVDPDPYTKSSPLLECDCGADAWNARVEAVLKGGYA